MSTTFKVGSTLTTGTTSTPGVTITANAAAPAGQALFTSYDYQGAAIWWTGNNLNLVSEVFGDRLRALGPSTLFRGIGFDGRTGRANPGCAAFPGSVATTFGPRRFSGSGAPSGVVVNPLDGDIYDRTDTPTTANQRTYRYENGAWVAKL